MRSEDWGVWKSISKGKDQSKLFNDTGALNLTKRFERPVSGSFKRNNYIINNAIL